MLRHVDLCSGIGGFSLGFKWAGLSEPILFCDYDEWCRKVLAKHWPNVPIAKDVKELANDPKRNVPDCDILTAGYPCQPFSLAGKRGGSSDDRHIWPYIFSIVEAKRPNWCVFENVYGHLSMGIDEVLTDLESKLGYTTRTFCVPAAGVNAPHKRNRLWIIAHTDRQSEPNVSKHEQRLLADTSSKNLQGGTKEQIHGESNIQRQLGRSGEDQREQWSAQPELGGVADGLSTRMDGFDGWEVEPEDIPRVVIGMKGRANRLKGLGNAIVPQIAMNIGLAIKEQMESEWHK